MSTDLPVQLDGWNTISESLAELRAGHEDCGRFFAEWCDQVGSLVSELVREQEVWCSGRDQTQSELDQRAESLARQQQQVVAERAALEQERSKGQREPEDPNPQEQLRNVLENVQHQWSAWVESLPGRDIQADPWATILGQLAQTREELAQAKGEIQRLAEPLESVTHDAPARQTSERLQAEVEQIRQERDAIRGEQLLLEAELENVRRRAAQLAETLDEQKRTAAEQESYWRGEFKRQCAFVERLMGHWGEAIPGSANAPDEEAENLSESTPTQGPNRGNEGGGVNAALESVKAQFELLQKDATRRRNRDSGST